MSSFKRLVGYILAGFGGILMLNTIILPFALYFAEGQPLWLALLAAPACFISGFLLTMWAVHLIERPYTYHGALIEAIGTGLMWVLFAVVFFGGFAVVIGVFLSPVAPVGIILFGLWLAALKAIWAQCRNI